MRPGSPPGGGTSLSPAPDPAFADHAQWVETAATVTTCRYQFARLNTFTLGIPTTRRFRVTFDYYAHGRLYSGELQANHAIPQDTQIPVRYNPLDPAQNSLAAGLDAGASVPPIILFGIAGSVVLSLLWFAFLRGCS